MVSSATIKVSTIAAIAAIRCHLPVPAQPMTAVEKASTNKKPQTAVGQWRPDGTNDPTVTTRATAAVTAAAIGRPRPS